MSAAQNLVLPLFPGQKLTRDEFLRRWDALPELKNAELIDGIVYMSSPVSNWHRRLDKLVIMWLAEYEAATPGCEAGANGTWLMLEGVPQPDADLRILPEYGGQSRTEGKYPAGAPELVVEVCASSQEYDFGPKLALYQRAGVREYITVSHTPAEVIWREVRAGQYVPLAPGADGTLRSGIFPGLWLDAAALIAGDAARILECLREGLASAEHARFGASLRK